ncbi:hypothetical protein D3C86_1986820 [compost metagenome]
MLGTTAGLGQRLPQCGAAPRQGGQVRPRPVGGHQHHAAVAGGEQHRVHFIQGIAHLPVVAFAQGRGIAADEYQAAVACGAQRAIQGVEALAQVAGRLRLAAG